MVPWRFILTDLTGVEIAEVFQAANRSVSRPLNGLPTAGFTIPLDNPLADTIIGATPLQYGNLILKVYRGSTRMFVGPIVALEEAAQAERGTLSVTAAGVLWRLFRRLIGKAPGGYGDGTPLAMKDLGQIAKGMIDVANAEGDTGIRVGTIGASQNSYVGPWYFKKIAEAIVEIGPGTLGGFDFTVDPEEPVVDAGGLKLGTFRAAGFLGTARNTVFEYGTGLRNVASYRRPITAEGLANKVYHLAPGYPDAVDAALTPVISAVDSASIAARLIHEDVAGGDLAPNDLRQKLVNEHVAIRKRPRELVVFTPIPNLPHQYGADYVEGDTVTARAVYRNKVRFNAVFRIYGVSFSIDDQGNETAELTLVNEA